MKKIYALLLCMVCILSLSACGRNGSSPDAPPLQVSAGGETITPYRHFAYGCSREKDGFLCADGPWVGAELPRLAEEGLLPEIAYGDGLTFTYTDADYRDIFLFDEAYERLEDPENTAALSTLDAGTYYVGVLAERKGAYIRSEKEHEYAGWVCVFRLIKE